MKIIDAVWEKRNLGVSCVEMEVGKADAVSEVVNELRKRTEQYQVVKAAPGRPDMAFAIQDEGFRYIETLFETTRRFKGKPETPEICKKYERNISYRFANNSEIERVLDEIRIGEIFSTDRIALDPKFSRQLAGQRYAFWMEDVFTRGNASMVISNYLGDDIGFDIHIDKGKYCEMVLGGLFSEYKDCGLGFANTYCGINAAYEEGARVIKSHVSSNNYAAYRLHMLFGMQVRSMEDVFIKHT